MSTRRKVESWQVACEEVESRIAALSARIGVLEARREKLVEVSMQLAEIADVLREEDD